MYEINDNNKNNTNVLHLQSGYLVAWHPSEYDPSPALGQSRFEYLAYYEESRICLSSIIIDQLCLSCIGTCSGCLRVQQIIEYYAAIVNTLTRAISQDYIPSIPTKSLRPFWTDELDDSKVYILVSCLV